MDTGHSMGMNFDFEPSFGNAEPQNMAEKMAQMRQKLLEECLLPVQDVLALSTVPELGGCKVIHLKTEGEANVLGKVVGSSGREKSIYKHVFLAHNSGFRRSIIDYYRAMGVQYIDIVVLNRESWKIFLFADWPSLHV